MRGGISKIEEGERLQAETLMANETLKGFFWYNILHSLIMPYYFDLLYIVAVMWSE